MFGRIRFTIAVILISISASVQAAPPPELQGYRISKIWDFNDSQESWVPDHNVSKFLIKDSLISFSNTGPDPWIINPKLELNTSKFSFLAIRMRSSNSGSNQIYFTTSESPIMGERNVIAHSVIGDGDFHVYTVDMSQLPTWKGTLTCLRIDTVNGGQEVGAKIDIDWIALYQTPANIVMVRPYAGMKNGKIKVHLPITNTGGEPSEPGLLIDVNGIRKKMDAIAPRKTVNLGFTLPISSKPIKASGKFKNKLLFEANLVSPYDDSSFMIAHGNKNTIISFSTSTSGIMYLYNNQKKDGELYQTGIFRPMGVIAYKDKDGAFRYLELDATLDEFKPNEYLTLSSRQSINDGTATITWKFSFSKGTDNTDMSCKVTSTVPIDVLRFEGPRLLVGEGSFGSNKKQAIFPGLEYLEANEPSSASWYIGPKYADRHIPNPNKITIPMMVVENDGIITGLSWNSTAALAPGKQFLSAEFESPNKSGFARNHLMTLFAPGIPDYVNENAEFAKTPYKLMPGKSIEVSGSFFTQTGRALDAVTENLKPIKLQTANSIEGTIANCMKAYTESLYSPEVKGWKNHFGLHQDYGFNPMAASVILAESLRKDNPDLQVRCSIPSDMQLTGYLGTTLDWFSDARKAQVYSIIDRQSPDGGFPYRINDEMKQKVKDYSPPGTTETTLGNIGETNSGLIARELNGILAYALQTGDQKAIDAGLKSLDRMNQFSVPRGAQDWEVHVHAPDIYAAGLSVDANIYGYYLTGNRKYLDKAKYWAYTGVPFVYDWVPPIDPIPASIWHFDEKGEGKNLVTADPSEFYNNTERFINPGSTIAVMGTSFYIVNWFGNPVQWCGLAWSNAVQRYLDIESDETLSTVVGNVFASATQQQNEKGFLAGTYTDSWNLTTNTTSPIYITPDLIIEHAYYLINEKRPFEIRSTGFNIDSSRMYMNSYAIISKCEQSDKSVEADLKFYPNQDVYTCISRAKMPLSVMVDDIVLKETNDPVKVESGFFYDKAHSSLHIKYRSSKRNAHLVVKW